MVYVFSDQRSQFGEFYVEGLAMEDVGTFVDIWSVYQIFYGHYLHLVIIWYISPRFGMLCEEKSGNPGSDIFEPKQ
jgi:hypothetical protein